MLSKKSNPLRKMIKNGSKIPKNQFLMYFDLATRASDLIDGLQDTTLCRFSSSRFFLSDSFCFKDNLD